MIFRLNLGAPTGIVDRPRNDHAAQVFALTARNPPECSALNSSSRDERDRTRRNLGTVLDRAGFRLGPAAVYFEMLTCSHCGAAFPACGQCPFCRRPS